MAWLGSEAAYLAPSLKLLPAPHAPAYCILYYFRALAQSTISTSPPVQASTMLVILCMKTREKGWDPELTARPAKYTWKQAGTALRWTGLERCNRQGSQEADLRVADSSQAPVMGPVHVTRQYGMAVRVADCRQATVVDPVLCANICQAPVMGPVPWASIWWINSFVAPVMGPAPCASIWWNCVASSEGVRAAWVLEWRY
eukprot:1155616-Pelagomonas_calceolata.AAC.20